MKLRNAEYVQHQLQNDSSSAAEKEKKRNTVNKKNLTLQVGLERDAPECLDARG